MRENQKEQFISTFEMEHAAKMAQWAHERQQAQNAVYAAAGLKGLIVSSLRDAGHHETADYVEKEIERRMEALMKRSAKYTTHLEPGEFGEGATVRRAPENG